jgi:Fe-Mn family superoxide dismutase
MAFELPALPYADTALEPHYTQKTIGFHYGKHHRAYVDNLNKLVAGTDLEKKSLEEVIRAAAGNPEKVGIFNNSAQVWNHTFFWHSMKPAGGGKPGGDLLAAIEKAFGGYDKFVEQFKAAAVGRFGSGWAWLVVDGGALKIVTTANAETPITAGLKPLLTVDVWEHAYYLDYQNRRPDFVQTVFDKLVNWDFAAANFKK